MNLSDAKELFTQRGSDAPALLETAREYMDAHDYSLAEGEFWTQADLVLSAISNGDDALIGTALHLWKTSPGASGRISSLDPEEARRINVTEAAEAIGVTRKAINKALNEGRLKGARNASGNWEIVLKDLREWDASRKWGKKK